MRHPAPPSLVAAPRAPAAAAAPPAPPAPSVADLVDAQRRQQAHAKSVSMEKLRRDGAARAIGAAARAAIIRRGIAEADLLPPSPVAGDDDGVRDRGDDESPPHGGTGFPADAGGFVAGGADEVDERRATGGGAASRDEDGAAVARSLPDRPRVAAPRKARASRSRPRHRPWRGAIRTRPRP